MNEHQRIAEKIAENLNSIANETHKSDWTQNLLTYKLSLAGLSQFAQENWIALLAVYCVLCVIGGYKAIRKENAGTTNEWIEYSKKTGKSVEMNWGVGMQIFSHIVLLLSPAWYPFLFVYQTNGFGFGTMLSWLVRSIDLEGKRISKERK